MTGFTDLIRVLCEV